MPWSGRGALAVVVLWVALWGWTFVRFDPGEPRGADDPEFSALRAHATLGRLLPDDLPHPLGSPEQERVRARLVGELVALGVEPEVQRAEACSPLGGCGTVHNLIVTIPGQRESVGLIAAHYDSVPGSPGAADDGSGVAILIELARRYRHTTPTNTLVLLFTEGEEVGLLGALAFVEQHPLAARVDAAVNLEARGAAGLSHLFESGDDSAWLIRAFAERAPRPFLATSVSDEVFALMPHYTDLAVFKAFGVPGLGFAFAERPEVYHTAQDAVGNLELGTLQRHGDNAFAATEVLANVDLVDHPVGDAGYFDVLGMTLVWWPLHWTLPLALGGLGCAGFVGWKRRKTLRRGALVVGATLGGAAAIAAVLSMVATGAAAWVAVALGGLGCAGLAARWADDEAGVAGVVGLVSSGVGVFLAVMAPAAAYPLVLLGFAAALAAQLGGTVAATGVTVAMAVLWLPLSYGLGVAFGPSGAVVVVLFGLAPLLPSLRPLSGAPRLAPALVLGGAVVAALVAAVPVADQALAASHVHPQEPPVEVTLPPTPPVVLADVPVAAGEFWWGVATSPFQTEDPAVSPGEPGYFRVDWDLFHERGGVDQGRGQGAGSYSRVERDVAALRRLGVSHYRFGIEWARVEPEPGRYNEQALRHYVALARALRSEGIEPIVCLWHFTFPDWATDLDDPSRHGWTHPKVRERWAAYAAKVGRAMGPHVSWYAPQNEPNAQAMAGWFLGIWPPGQTGDLQGYRRQTGAAALAFREAAEALRAYDDDAQILTVQNWIAWRRATWDGLGVFAAIGDHYNHEHLDRVVDTVDVVGFNYYHRRVATPLGTSEDLYPRGIREGIVDLTDRYGLPVAIMENGLGSDDDNVRQAAMRAHVRQVQLARSAGRDVRGYFAWSLMDNYEWALGYDSKYGLFAVDPHSWELEPKGSAALYQRLIVEDVAPGGAGG